MPSIDKLSPEKKEAFNNRIGLGASLLIGLLFLGLAGFEADQNRKFNGSVDRVDGTVERLYVSTTLPGVRFWMIGYRYDTLGVIYHQECGLIHSDWIPLHEGDSVPVKYLKEYPGDSRIDLPLEDQANWQTPWPLGAVGFGMLVLTGLIARKYRRS